MNDVFAEVDGKVTADGSGLRSVRVGSADHFSAALDDIMALPYHRDDGAGARKSDQGCKKGALLMLTVMFLEANLAWLGQVKAHKFVALAFEP